MGEKETSEQAAIVARYADLFTREQLETLAGAEAAAAGDDREEIARLRLTCQEGIVDRELAEREDALENALLAARVALGRRRASAPLGPGAPGRRGRLRRPRRARRRRARGVGLLQRRAPLAPRREERAGGRRHGRAPTPSRATRRRRASRFARFSTRSTARGSRARRRSRRSGSGGSTACSGPTARRRLRTPTWRGSGASRRSRRRTRRSGACPVCLATLAALGFDLEAEQGIRPDLEDRPQKSPRACVIAADPPRVVHLITRAQGGLHDYEAFLHEAGHALHYAGCDPALPLAFRRLARDHALTEIYSFLLDSISGEPGWHAEHFGLSDEEARENADAARFSNTLLFRRYSAKLGYEMDFWKRFPTDGGTPDGYEERLTAATGVRYPAANHLADMDAGFYSADYLRAWIRSAQLRAHLRREVGEDWWRRPETGALLREPLPRGHAADDRGDRRADRLRPARHRAARRRARRPEPASTRCWPSTGRCAPATSWTATSSSSSPRVPATRGRRASYAGARPRPTRRRRSPR